MNNKCIYLKQKLNRKLECKKDKNKIIPKDCANCILKTYKCTELNKNCAKRPKKSDTLSNNHQIKNKSNKLAKLERNRTSLFTDNMTKCYFCSNKKEHIHELFFGRNRRNSMIYGLTLPLCAKHHDIMQNDKGMIDLYHKKGQILFNKTYPDLDFQKIFKRNYL